MPCYNNINGSLRRDNKLYDNINGSLRTVNYGYDNINGALRQYHANYVPPPPPPEENIYNNGTENVTISSISGMKTVNGISAGAWRNGNKLTIFPCGDSQNEPQFYTVYAEIIFAPVTWNRRYLCVTFDIEANNGSIDFIPLDSAGNALATKLHFGTKLHNEAGNAGSGTGGGKYVTHYNDITYFREENPIDTSTYTICADLSKMNTRTWCLKINGRIGRSFIYSPHYHIKRIWKTDNQPSGILWSYNFRRVAHGEVYDSTWPSTKYENVF